MHLINFALCVEVIIVSGLLEMLFSYLRSVEKEILDPDYHLENANIQQISSYKSLLGRTLMLQMNRVPYVLEMWLFPAPWTLWASCHLAMGHCREHAQNC